jgi:hypothetical protein
MFATPRPAKPPRPAPRAPPHVSAVLRAPLPSPQTISTVVACKEVVVTRNMSKAAVGAESPPPSPPSRALGTPIQQLLIHHSITGSRPARAAARLGPPRSSRGPGRLLAAPAPAKVHMHSWPSALDPDGRLQWRDPLCNRSGSGRARSEVMGAGGPTHTREERVWGAEGLAPASAPLAFRAFLGARACTAEPWDPALQGLQ